MSAPEAPTPVVSATEREDRYIYRDAMAICLRHPASCPCWGCADIYALLRRCAPTGEGAGRHTLQDTIHPNHEGGEAPGAVEHHAEREVLYNGSPAVASGASAEGEAGAPDSSGEGAGEIERLASWCDGKAAGQEEWLAYARPPDGHPDTMAARTVAGNYRAIARILRSSRPGMDAGTPYT